MSDIDNLHDSIKSQNSASESLEVGEELSVLHDTHFQEALFHIDKQIEHLGANFVKIVDSSRPNCYSPGGDTPSPPSYIKLRKESISSRNILPIL